MPNSKKQLTLDRLAKLINDGFSKTDRKFASTNHQLVQLLNETTHTRTEVERLRSEINQRFNKVDKRFDDVDDKLQNLLNEVDIITDQKLEKFRQKYMTA